MGVGGLDNVWRCLRKLKHKIYRLGLRKIVLDTLVF